MHFWKSVLCLLLCCSSAGIAGEFKPVFTPSENPAYAELAKAIKDTRLLEDLAAGLNETLILPTDVLITFADCGQPNAFYTPEHKAVIMCYEFVVDFAETLTPIYDNETDLYDAIFGTTMFFFYHEVGHALVDVLDLPITGRQEDAVDQLSTLILLALDDPGSEPVGGPAILSAALWFFQTWQKMEASGMSQTYFGEHSLTPQRFFNLACWTFGSNPDLYSWVVQDGMLPSDRAQQCPGELDRFDKAWGTLMDKHFRP